MARDLLTIRTPDDIRQAIEERMSTTGKGKTEVVLELLRTALGMPSTTTAALDITALDERITIMLDERTTELNQRTTVSLDQCKTLLYEEVTARVEKAIAPVKGALAAMEDALGECSA